ncbi:MAG: T9SS type A sorting domain-containing protein [Chitinophagales bacterium]|nr:T9SS type A sorting domain-containing protein [Chitinophagales bacterium]
MQRNLLFLFLFTFQFNANAQQEFNFCGFEKYVQQNFHSVNEANETILNYPQKVSSHKHGLTDTVKIIPVVVHVIHNGGIENISDEQIESQLRVLNEDFRKIAETNGDGSGVDTKIEFCLSKKNPEGKCTNGIVRIQSLLTNHDSYERPMLSQLSSWDPDRYVNIYVVKTIDGGSVLGYASFPGGPIDQDGLVVVYNAFGDTLNVNAPYNLGRTATHEISHWFGLYHTFNNGCAADTCNDGDYVCDTPPVATANFGCPSNANSCSNDFPNVNDQVENYMDYTNDACKNIFTAGQRDRMQSTLNAIRFEIWQDSNLAATGCDSDEVVSNCAAVADFITLQPQVCVGNSVLFYNKSLNNCTSFLWSFTGANPSSSTILNPTVTYNTLGSFDVKLIATNAFGTDSVTFINYITVVNPSAGIALPYHEGFESSLFPPAGITIENSDNGITWERDTIAVHPEGIASAKINNLINTNYGQTDAMILPNLNLSSFNGTPYLTFKWAYAKSDALYTDQLLVLISTDCGVNFTQIFSKSGSSLATGPTQITPYIPDSNTIWKSANVSLANYESSSNAIIKLVNVTDGGNNLYVDDIGIGITTGVNETANENTFTIFPNPATDFINLTLVNKFQSALEISLLDVLGKNVREISLGKANSQISIPIADLSDGIYFIRIFDGEHFNTYKFIKN